MGKRRPITIFICSSSDMNLGEQICLEQEEAIYQETRSLDFSAPPVCWCDREYWIICPEAETDPEGHRENACPYQCFEGEILCPYCEGEPEPQTVYDPMIEFVPDVEPDEIECIFNGWVSSLGKHS